MIKGCFECVIKHLGTAETLEEEYHLGYPKFYRKIIGNLNLAAIELLAFRRDLALIIREHRLLWEADQQYRIPYEALAYFIDGLSKAREQDMPELEIPDDCTDGLMRSADGGIIFTID